MHAGRAPDADVVHIVGVRDTQDLTLSVAWVALRLRESLCSEMDYFGPLARDSAKARDS